MPQLTQDEFALLAVIPDDGGAVGNTSARKQLNWSKLRYDRARSGLLTKGLVARRQGGGGALARLGKGPEPLQMERKLYDPILRTLQTDWSRERGFTPLAAEIIAHAGRKQTGGRWTRPDLVVAGLKTFTYVPKKRFEVVTFEVKPMAQLNVIAVYEALAHRRAATHAYVLAEVRTELAEAMSDKLAVVKSTAEEHGIGLITFNKGDDWDTWDEVVPAALHHTEPEALDEFIESQLSTAGKQAIIDGTA